MTIQMYRDLLIENQQTMLKNPVNKGFTNNCIPNCILHFQLDKLTLLEYNKTYEDMDTRRH